MIKSGHNQQSNNHKINSSELPGQWLFYFIATIGVLVSLFLWYIFVLQSTANLHRVIQLQAEHISKDIDVQLKLRISALKHMAKHLEKESPISEENWQDIAGYLLEYGGFEGVMWVNPDLQTIKMSSTAKPASQALYSKWVNNYQAEIKNTANTGLLWLSPLLDNQPSQDEDIFAVMPVWNAEHQLLGYLISVIDLAGALDLPLYHLDYAVLVYYDNHLLFQNMPVKGSTGIKPYITDLTFYGIHWRVSVQPSQHFISTIANHLSGIALTQGIIIALLFAIAARLALVARQRARILQSMNLDLKKEITERIQAEESKKRMEKELLQGQKLQAIGTLAGGIAHDFNNILYAIIGYAEMAREDVPKNTVTYANLSKVLEGSHRGRELVARILAFGRRQSHHDFLPLQLKRSIENALALLKPTVPSSVTINFISAGADHCTVLGNETQIHQVIVNLINNAVYAMNENGIITIRLSEASAKQLPEIIKNSYCKIEITDTGQGMDANTLERIFEPFFTTKEVGKGSGLGLAIVHAIVEDHEGKIIVTSEPGQGSTFTIILPMYTPTANIQGV